MNSVLGSIGTRIGNTEMLTGSHHSVGTAVGRGMRTNNVRDLELTKHLLTLAIPPACNKPQYASNAASPDDPAREVADSRNFQETVESDCRTGVRR
jgi:hypothetical protein